MRRIAYKIWNKAWHITQAPDTSAYIDGGVGFFHGWTNAAGLANPHAFAIIEKDDGTVALVEHNLVRFLKESET